MDALEVAEEVALAIENWSDLQADSDVESDGDEEEASFGADIRGERFIITIQKVKS